MITSKSISDDNVSSNDFEKKNKNLSFSGHSHSFDVGIAIQLGIDAAIILNHIIFWLMINKRRGVNYRNGRTFMYQTYEQMSHYLPYFNPRQLKHSLQKLVEAEILVVEKFKKSAFDHTNWYALADESVLENLTKKVDGTNLSHRKNNFKNPDNNFRENEENDFHEQVDFKENFAIRQICPISQTTVSQPHNIEDIEREDKDTSFMVPAAKPSLDERAIAEKENISHLNSPKKQRQPITDEVKEVGERMIALLQSANPSFIKPKDINAWLLSLDLLMRVDKRDPDEIVSVLQWALADSFWSPNMYKKNPFDYLRKQYAMLFGKMNAPTQKKPRKFAPSSNDEKAYQLTQNREWIE